MRHGESAPNLLFSKAGQLKPAPFTACAVAAPATPTISPSPSAESASCGTGIPEAMRVPARMANRSVNVEVGKCIVVVRGMN